MKKFISIVAALSMVASLSVTSFAAINVSVSEKDKEKATLVESNGTFTADLATGSNTSQDTIVVVKGDGSVINTTSIQYINQADASQNFNFVLKDEPTKEADFGGASSLTYTVLMGGDKVAKTEVGTITYTYTPDVVKYTVIFKDANGETLSTAEYEENATVAIPADQTKADDETYTYTFEGWKVEGADDNTATKSITATANATYVPVFTATPKVPAGSDEFTLTFLKADGSTFATTVTVNGVPQLPETDPTKANSGKKQYGFVGWYTDAELTSKIADATISADANIYPKFVQIGVYGDANADGQVNTIDVGQVKQKIKQGTAYTGLVEKPYENCQTSKSKDGVRGDANGDGKVNTIDVGQIKQKIKQGTAYTGTVGTLMTVVKD